MVRIDRSGTEKFVQPHTLDKAACKAAIDTLAEIAPEFVDPRSGSSLDALWRAHPEHGSVRERIDIG